MSGTPRNRTVARSMCRTLTGQGLWVRACGHGVVRVWGEGWAPSICIQGRGCWARVWLVQGLELWSRVGVPGWRKWDKVRAWGGSSCTRWAYGIEVQSRSPGVGGRVLCRNPGSGSREGSLDSRPGIGVQGRGTGIQGRGWGSAFRVEGRASRAGVGDFRSQSRSFFERCAW